MKNKKILTVILLIIIFIGGVFFYFYFIKADKRTTLTANEKNWIEKNKNNLIDLAIPSDVPVLSNNGDGVIFDFLEDLEEDTGLEFNKLSYTKSEKQASNYIIKSTNNVTKKDVLIYQDNYILVSKNKNKFTSPSEIDNVVIGVLEEDASKVEKYLTGSGKVSYKKYKDETSMLDDINSNLIDIVALPRLANLDAIIKNKNLNIVYNISEYPKKYIIELGTNKTLNNILHKYYTKWSKEKFEEDFNKSLVETYFSVKKVGEQQQVKFRSKRYSYGFVINSPFDMTVAQGLRGFNYSLLNSFSKASNIEFDYKKYSSLNTLTKDFGENKLDIIFNYSHNEKYNMDTYNTISVYDEKIALITDQNTDLAINSINSLTDQKVLVIKDSKIEEYLKEKSIETKSYDNINNLINNLGKNDMAAIDYYTYDYYVRSNLNNYKNLYTFNLDKNYDFISRDISANETFNELLDFYLSFVNSNQIINNSYKDLLNYNNGNKLFKILVALFSAVLLVIIGIITGKLIKRHRNPHHKLSKADKLRYIDNLTSLKNRDYLNDNINDWDSSNIYPQAIIIIDLNNIAYINDNFGHAEGDKVIVEGAGILIANQLPNSEIIRSNGNEFLIYVLKQDEKKIITFIRKLHREFKKISHGFGAAIGYSIITDEIKTIDDAVNEATIDMRNNKEENKQ